MVWLWGAAQGAEPSCEPLDESGFQRIVTTANEAIRGDDPEGHAAAARALEAQIPCLTFVPSPTVWAEYLVGAAAVTYLGGGDWQAPLEAALRVAPGIDRAVGADHEIALWTLPPPLPSPGDVPSGATLYVDGLKATELPAADGLHLVQVRAAGSLRSALIRDAPVPAEWFPAVVEPTAESGPRRALIGSVVGGLMRFRQLVDEPGDYAADASELGPELGVSVRAVVAAAGPLGVSVDLLGTSAPRLDGALAATIGGRRGSAGLGVVLATAGHVEGDDSRRMLLAAPTLTLDLWLGPTAGPTVDLSLAAGWAPAYSRNVLRVGVTPGGERTRIRFGTEARFRESRFVQPDSGRTLAARDLSLLAEVGVVLGRW